MLFALILNILHTMANNGNQAEYKKLVTTSDPHYA